MCCWFYVCWWFLQIANLRNLNSLVVLLVNLLSEPVVMVIGEERVRKRAAERYPTREKRMKRFQEQLIPSRLVSRLLMDSCTLGYCQSGDSQRCCSRRLCKGQTMRTEKLAVYDLCSPFQITSIPHSKGWALCSSDILLFP